jgi:hypothetical protein
MTSHLPRVLWPVWLAGISACTNSPTYVEPREALEVGLPDPAAPGETIDIDTTQFFLPIRLETMQEQMERAAQATELGLAADAVPFVGLDDLEISIEWTIKNLSDTDGTARIQINGANELFVYVPSFYVIDPEEDEEPPPLLGTIPTPVRAGDAISGVFREDQLREAAIDLEQVTRGLVNPFAAILDYDADLEEIDDPEGPVVPRAAFGHLVQYDIIFTADQHMVLEYDLRIRDEAEILHERLLDAPDGELTVFMPQTPRPLPLPPMMGAP